jgi:hypothetical protein
MSDKPTELTVTEIQKLTEMTRAQVRFWTDGRVLDIKPSISGGRQGSAALFSIGDFYLICLAQSAALSKMVNFATIGLAIDAISRSTEWPKWENNRGRLSAKIGADGVELLYTPRVRPGTRTWDRNSEEFETDGLYRAIKKKEPHKPTMPSYGGTFDACTILFFELKPILDHADQRLAKILG